MFSRSQVFVSSGIFDVPAGVSGVFVTMIGGGGGGGGWPGGTGGAGCYAVRIPVNVTPLGTLAISIGAAGVGGTGNAFNGTVGGTTSVGGVSVQGGGTPLDYTHSGN